MKKKQLIDVIFASEKRKNVLLLLKDGPEEMTVLLKELNTNRPALLPQIRILEEHSLVYQSGDSYDLTTIGKIVVDEMAPFLNTIESLNKHSTYLSIHNTESIPNHLFERIGELRKCKIIEPSLVDTYEFNKSFYEKSKISKSLKFAFTFVHPSFREIISYYHIKKIDISIIITPDLFDKVKKEFFEEFRQSLEQNNMRFYIYNKDLKLSSLSISDDCFVLRLLFNNNEFSSKQIYCCHPEAYKWSRDLFDYFMKDAVRITSL